MISHYRTVFLVRKDIQLRRRTHIFTWVGPRSIICTSVTAGSPSLNQLFIPAPSHFLRKLQPKRVWIQPVRDTLLRVHVFPVRVRTLWRSSQSCSGVVCSKPAISDKLNSTWCQIHRFVKPLQREKYIENVRSWTWISSWSQFCERKIRYRGKKFKSTTIENLSYVHAFFIVFQIIKFV